MRKLDDRTYQLLRAHPVAVALREASDAWNAACAADDLNHSDPGPTLRAAQRADRAFLEAAMAFGEVVDKLREIIAFGAGLQ